MIDYCRTHERHSKMRHLFNSTEGAESKARKGIVKKETFQIRLERRRSISIYKRKYSQHRKHHEQRYRTG